jgi:hypothetical protein
MPVEENPKSGVRRSVARMQHRPFPFLLQGFTLWINLEISGSSESARERHRANRKQCTIQDYLNLPYEFDFTVRNASWLRKSVAQKIRLLYKLATEIIVLN